MVKRGPFAHSPVTPGNTTVPISLTGLSSYTHDGTMRSETRERTRTTYEARLRGGPDDGAVVRVTSLPSGGPPDFFHAGPDDQGVYVLAGMPHSDEMLPYWWIPDHSRLPIGAGPEGATWTLISMDSDGATAKVWHQHGAGTTPVRLATEPMASAQVPAFVGRGYICPECDDLTVVSLPPSEEGSE